MSSTFVGAPPEVLDPDLVEKYITMLKRGDVAGCLELRLKHMDDRELNRRLITVEQTHYSWVRLYIEEIQLLRMHVTALQNLADGHETSDRDKIRRGQKQLENVLLLRETLGEVDIPNPKDYS